MAISFGNRMATPSSAFTSVGGEVNRRSRHSAILYFSVINFDSHPVFSGACQLRGADELQMRALFTPQVLSFLETLDRSKKWRLEGGNDTLIVYRAGNRVNPADFRRYLEETSAIATSFFSYGGVRSTAN